MGNDLGLKGIEFVEFAARNVDYLDELFTAFGFSRLESTADQSIERYCQGDINFLVNSRQGSFADHFATDHGPSISAMGWRVENATKAFELAIARGATAADFGDYRTDGRPVPAIYGIGDSLIYFVDQPAMLFYKNAGFKPHTHPRKIKPLGFTVIDHLTNNVEQGTMEQWSGFYKNIFGFTEVRYFDIRGIKTGLTSYALRSPCGTFCIPINEGTEAKSQINEYLEEYKGPGVQHLAFLTDDIVSTLERMQGGPIEMLDIDDDYYKEVFTRVPGVTEDHEKLKKLNILVDGDDEGYLSQIFTKNLIGPIFIEIIQRKNHFAFGEGNFGALFRSIERDQERRGVLEGGLNAVAEFHEF